MNNADVRAVCQAQLARDLGCDPALLDGPESHVTLWRDHPGRRKYAGHTPLLEVAIWNGKLVAACGPELLPWAKEHFPLDTPEWLFTPSVFRDLEAALAPLGYEIGNARHFYLPDLPCEEVAPILPVRWYEGEALDPLRDHPDWKDAVPPGPWSPYFLAVAALGDDGEPVGLATCSRDGEKLWQIGIHTLPSCRGRGIAPNLTALLKNEVLRRGAVPFYCTAESHIFSQNVARKAGFKPAFAYLYARPISKGTT